MHVVTSVGWMGQAATLCLLLAVAMATDDPQTRTSAVSMAHLLDGRLLAPMANASAFTGFMLAAATPWGYFRHWWVLVKFAITIVQLYLGIFVLSNALNDADAAAAAGTSGPTGALVVGSGLMAGAIAFQAWLSTTKPWPQTPWTAGQPKARGSAPPIAPRSVFVVTVLAAAGDLTVTLIVGDPTPLLSLLTLGVWLTVRTRRLRAARRAQTPTPRPAVPDGAS